MQLFDDIEALARDIPDDLKYDSISAMLTMRCLLLEDSIRALRAKLPTNPEYVDTP